MAGQTEKEIAKRSDTLVTVLVATSQVVILGTAVMMLLSEFVSIAPLLAGVGVASIAIGFGAQSLVTDASVAAEPTRPVHLRCRALVPTAPPKLD